MRARCIRRLPVEDADPEADRRLLEAIADWCDRYTPLVGLDPPDGLAARHHRLRASVRRRGGALPRSGRAARARKALQARVAVADTVGCAWAVARYRRRRTAWCRAARRAAALAAAAARGAAPRARDRRGAGAGRAQAHRRCARRVRARRSPRASARSSCAGSTRRSAARTSRSRRACRCRPRWPSSASPSRSRAKRDVLGTIEQLARELGRAAGAARRGRAAVCRSRCSAPTARCIGIEVGTGAPLRDAARIAPSVRRAARRARRRLRSRLRLRHGAALGAGRPSAAIRRRPALPAPDHDGGAGASDRPARRALRPAPRDAARAAGHAYSGIRGGGGAGACAAVKRDAAIAVAIDRSSRTASLPARPIRLFERPEPIEAIAEVPDGPPVRFRWRRVLHEVAHAEGPGAHRHGMVARRARPRAHARLFPRRKPRRACASGSIAKGFTAARRAAALVPARAVRMSNVVRFRVENATCKSCVRRLCRACRHHQFLLSARRLASGRAGRCRRSSSGLAGLGIADRNSVAGVVRAHVTGARTQGSRAMPFKIAVGARLVFADGTPDILAYPQDRAAWGRLTRLLTARQAPRREGRVHSRLAGSAGAYRGPQPHRHAAGADRGRRSSPTLLDAIEAGHVAPLRLARRQHALSRRRRAAAGAACRRSPADACVPLIAVNDVLYHAPERRALQDVVTCIREHVTLDSGRPPARSQCRAASQSRREEMARLFRRAPEAIDADAALSRALPLLARRAAQHRISRRNPRRAIATPQEALVAFAEEGARGAIPTACRRRCATRSTDELRAHRRARLRAVFPHRRTTSCSFARSQGHPLPGPRLGGEFGRSAIASASPRSIPRRSICCSSASSRPSGASRPTSTSISSTSGARR